MEELIRDIQEPDGFWIGYETSSNGGAIDSGEVKWLPKFYCCSKCRIGTAVRTPNRPYCGRKVIIDN